MKRKFSALAALLALLTVNGSMAAEKAVFSGVSTKGNLSVWRINHQNGAVSLCSFEGHMNRPVCYPWSDSAKGNQFSIIPGDDVLSTWRINSETGSVSLCEYKEVSEAPICTPWSKE